MMLIVEMLLLGALLVSGFLWLRQKDKKQYRIGASLAIFTVVFAIILMACDIWQAILALCVAVLLCLAYLVRRTPLSNWPLRITGLFFAMLFALAVLPLYLFPIPSLPKPTGSWHVGTQEFEMVDTSRDGAMYDDPQTPRRLFVRVWYPTDAASGKRRPYLTKREADVTIVSVGNHFGVGSQYGLGNYVYKPLRHIKAHAFENAEVSQTDDMFPTLIFSHGYLSWVGQNTALMELLASHGYIIYSVSHPYDGADIPFADGSVIKTQITERVGYTDNMVGFLTGETHEDRLAFFDSFKTDFDQYRIRKSVEPWGEDVAFLTNTLAQNRTPDSMRAVAAKTDMSKFGMIGMSFGGSNVAYECHKDVRCKAAVNLDGEEFVWELYDTDIRMPFLMIHGDWWKYGFWIVPKTPDFHINDYAYERWETTGERDDVYRIRVKGLQHLGFMDFPITLRMPLRDKAYGSQNGKKALAAVNETVLAFLDKHVKGDPTNFPADVLSQHPALDLHDPRGVSRWWRARDSENGE
ncbi:MAG: hypothetical protein COB36_12640 [Alphaproteobacteria bacterium]|nr:MAG: hypothetical protein COB36_12640 [Alphaproteobacteria bacterium]